MYSETINFYKCKKVLKLPISFNVDGSLILPSIFKYGSSFIVLANIIIFGVFFSFLQVVFYTSYKRHERHQNPWKDGHTDWDKEKAESVKPVTLPLHICPMKPKLIFLWKPHEEVQVQPLQEKKYSRYVHL